MIKCSNCGHETNKTKLTLSVDRELVKKAKEAKLNLSQVMENALRGVIAIVAIMVLLIPVSAVYAQRVDPESLLRMDNVNSFWFNEVKDACISTYIHSGNVSMSEPCYRFYTAYVMHIDRLFTENEDVVNRILVGPKHSLHNTLKLVDFIAHYSGYWFSV